MRGDMLPSWCDVRHIGLDCFTVPGVERPSTWRRALQRSRVPGGRQDRAARLLSACSIASSSLSRSSVLSLSRAAVRRRGPGGRGRSVGLSVGGGGDQVGIMGATHREGVPTHKRERRAGGCPVEPPSRGGLWDQCPCQACKRGRIGQAGCPRDPPLVYIYRNTYTYTPQKYFLPTNRTYLDIQVHSSPLSAKNPWNLSLKGWM